MRSVPPFTAIRRKFSGSHQSPAVLKSLKAAAAEDQAAVEQVGIADYVCKMLHRRFSVECRRRHPVSRLLTDFRGITAY